MKTTATRKVKVGQEQRLATFQQNSYNEENRTIEVVFSTGAAVMRSNIFGDRYIEELDMSPSSIRLERLNKGAPVLDSHNAWSLRSQLGVVENARIENGQAIATLRFSDREEVQPMIQDIRNGIIKNVSVGYFKHKMVEQDARDGVRVVRAMDWEPFEISFVTVPADADSQARSAELEAECEVVLAKKQEPAPDPAPVSERSKADNGNTDIEPNNVNQRVEEGSMDPKEIEEMKKKAAEKAREDERARVSSIEEAVRKAGLDDETREKFIKDGTDINDVRAQIIDLMADKDKRTSTPSTNVSVGQDLGREGIRSGVESAILHRHDAAKYDLHETGNRFRSASLLDMAKECVRAAGHSNVDQMERKEIVRLALRSGGAPGHHSSSDFPLILENVITKTLQRGYQEAPATWMPLAREVTVNDFKQVSRVHLGEASGLDPVQEGGEYKYGTLGERAEKYAVEKFGKMLAVTWEMIINDDISAFTSVPAKLGKKARDLESDKTWNLLIANTQVMAETAQLLFSAPHNNLNLGGGAGGVTETALAAIRSAMRSHKDLGGDSPINLFPSNIFVGTTREVETMKILRDITPNQSSQVNVFGQDAGFRLTPIVEPRLDVGSNPWFVSADLMSTDILEVARLAGEETPQVFTRDGFEVDGLEFKVRHLFIAHAIDYRGLQRNDGA